MSALPKDHDLDPLDEEAPAVAGEQQVDRTVVRQIIVWLVVLAPLTYGVFNTVEKALPLF